MAFPLLSCCSTWDTPRHVLSASSVAGGRLVPASARCVTIENVEQSTRLLRHYCFLFSSFFGKYKMWGESYNWKPMVVSII